MNLPQDREEDVDPEINATAGDEEDTEWRDWCVVSMAVQGCSSRPGSRELGVCKFVTRR